MTRNAITSQLAQYRAPVNQQLRENRKNLRDEGLSTPHPSAAAEAQPVDATLGEGEGGGERYQIDPSEIRTTPLTAIGGEYSAFEERRATRGADSRRTPTVMPKGSASKGARKAKRKLALKKNAK